MSERTIVAPRPAPQGWQQAPPQAPPQAWPQAPQAWPQIPQQAPPGWRQPPPQPPPAWPQPPAQEPQAWQQAPQQAPPGPPPGYPPQRRGPSRRMWIAILAALVLIAGGFGAYKVMSNNSGTAPNHPAASSQPSKPSATSPAASGTTASQFKTIIAGTEERQLSAAVAKWNKDTSVAHPIFSTLVGDATNLVLTASAYYKVVKATSPPGAWQATRLDLMTATIYYKTSGGWLLLGLKHDNQGYLNHGFKDFNLGAKYMHQAAKDMPAGG